MIDLDKSEKVSAYESNKIIARDWAKGKTAQQIAEMWVTRREMLESASDIKSGLEAWCEIISMESLPDAMEREGIEMANWEGIGKVTTEAVVFVSLPSGHKELFYAWLKKNKMGDLIQSTVNSSTLTAWVKARMREGKPLPTTKVVDPETKEESTAPMLKVTPATRAKLTKPKG